MQEKIPPVLLIEPDPTQRLSLTLYLTQMGREVESCATAEDALRLLGTGLRPIWICMALTLRDMTSREFRWRMLKDPELRDIPVFIATDYPLLPRTVLELLVDGYLLKSRTYGKSDESVRPSKRLTQREAQVVALVMNGCSNQNIASQLGIALPTAKMHVSQLLRKLGFQSRLELVSRYTGPSSELPIL